MTIRVRDLVKRFDGKTVIDGVSLEVEAGELAVLLGPSGCGKTTTLRCIAGLETPDAGEIDIDGRVVCSPARGIMVPPHQRRLGMVFQSYAIWPHLTVYGNVAFPLRIQRLPRPAIEAKVMRALEMVGLAHLRARPSQQLSGGQQQRVALARAIVHSPCAMLLDEPLSNLDAKLRDRTRAEIRRLQRELAVPAIYVTHDQGEALSISDRVFVMRHGRIVQAGTPRELYRAPRVEFVADAVGAATFLDLDLRPGAGPLVARGPDGSEIRVAGEVRRPGRHRAMVRPDRIAIALETAPVITDVAGLNVLHGTVEQRLFLGPVFEYAVRCGETMVRVVSPDEVEERARVRLTFRPEDCTVLDDDTELSESDR